MAICKGIVVGRVGKDPELKHTNGGSEVANFSIATTNYKKETVWHDCAAWGKLASLVMQYVHKGDALGVDAEITYSSWTDKNGSKQKRMVLKVQELQFLSSRSESSQQSAPAQQQALTNDNDDIPF